MKKYLAIFFAAVILCATCMFVSAETGAKENAEIFWVTHYDDGTCEGSGVIFAQEDTAGGWWLHVAFRPIGNEDVYEIAEISNGLSDGTAQPLAVPQGGFVWAANYGNDYISLGSGDTDFTSENCSAAIERAITWEVGQQFRIDGIDFQTVPTETPEVLWYNDGYVCTATIAPYNATAGSDSEVEKDPLAALEEELKALVGQLHEDAAFGWKIEVSVEKDGVATLKITASDLSAEIGLQGLVGQLHYNPEEMTLLTESNKENELQCVTALPSQRWENMSRLVRDEDGEIVPGLIELSVVNASDDTVVSEDAPVVLSLRFRMNEGYTYSGVYMPTESVYGLDTDVNEVIGNGAYAIVQAAVTEEDSSQESAPPPKPGDGGIVWLALLGVASFAGAMTLLRRRQTQL